MSVGSMPGPAGRSLPSLIQNTRPGEPGQVSLAGSAGFKPKPGILPLPCPWTPYFLPLSEPVVTKSIWSWNGLVHGGGSLDVDPLSEDDALPPEVALPPGVALPPDEPLLESSAVQGNSPGTAGNCRSTEPPQRLGPSAPQPEIGFNVFQSGV